MPGMMPGMMPQGMMPGMPFSFGGMPGMSLGPGQPNPMMQGMFGMPGGMVGQAQQGQKKEGAKDGKE